MEVCESIQGIDKFRPKLIIPGKVKISLNNYGETLELVKIELLQNDENLAKHALLYLLEQLLELYSPDMNDSTIIHATSVDFYPMMTAAKLTEIGFVSKPIEEEPSNMESTVGNVKSVLSNSTKSSPLPKSAVCAVSGGRKSRRKRRSKKRTLKTKRRR